MNDYSIKKTVIQIFDVPIAVIRRFSSDRLPRHAAALAFSSLLALAPMMAIALSMFSLFAGTEQLGSSLEDFIYKFLVPAAGDEVRVYLQQFSGQLGSLTVLGLFSFFVTALLLLSNIESSFNDIWRVTQGRNMTSRLTVYWALVSLGPIMMGASLAISGYLVALAAGAVDGYSQQVNSFGVVMLPFLLEMMAFMMLYLIMPNVRVSLIHALVGALVAVCLFELTKFGFRYYISNFANYKAVYGALSTLPVFLIWVYLSWVVALFGAEVVAVLQQKKLLENTLLDKISADDSEEGRQAKIELSERLEQPLNVKKVDVTTDQKVTHVQSGELKKAD